MFVSSPKMYYYNPAFELKMLLLVAAVLVQVLLLRRVSVSDSPTPVLVRATVALSLASWFGVGLAGANHWIHLAARGPLSRLWPPLAARRRRRAMGRRRHSCAERPPADACNGEAMRRP